MKKIKILTFSVFCLGVIILSLFTSCSMFNSKPKIITILGAVNRPGDYIVNKPVKFILLLFKAYGYREDADPVHAVVKRDKKSFFINLDIPANKPPPHLAETFTVYPGDVIMIPKKNKITE
jgi:protein involved in polysaccharide export with SLBB domain